MAIVSYDRVSANYGGQALAMLQNKEVLDHARYPIMVTETEKETIDFRRVLQIMSNHSRRPSEMAGLQPNGRVPTVCLVDDVFRNAMCDYENLLVRSSIKDEEKIIPLNGELREKISQQPDWAWEGFKSGLWFFFIGAIPGYFIGAKTNEWQEKANRRDEVDVLREGSAHRRAWMFTINALEIQRHEDIKFRLRNEAEPLFTELRALEEQDQHLISVSMRNELTQLNTVYNAISPHEVLTIDGIIVSDYLDNLPNIGGS